MRSNKVASLITIALISFAPNAMADTAPSNLVAVVNIQQVMRDSTAAQSVREQLESKQKTYKAEIEKKDDDLRKEDQDLSAKRSVLSKQAFDEKAAKFRTKATDLQKEVQSKKAVLDGAYEHAFTDIQKVVTDIIIDLSKEKGFSVALPTSQILYADPKLDISSEVLSRLNQKLTKVDVKFDAVSKDKKSQE